MNELDIFEPDEETMTVKQVASALNVSDRTVQRHLKSIRIESDNVVEHGKTSMVNEKEVTEIKLRIEKSGRSDLEQTKTLPKTELEKTLIIQQAIGFLNEKVEILQDENKALQIENKKMLPKAEFYDRVTDSSDTVDIAAVSQLLNVSGIGRNKLYELLREEKILKKYPLSLKNTPYQEYIDRGYFKVVETETGGGIKLKTLVYQKGLDFIRKKIDQIYS